MHNRTDVKPMFFLIPQERNYRIFLEIEKKKICWIDTFLTGGSGKLEMNRKTITKKPELHFF